MAYVQHIADHTNAAAAATAPTTLTNLPTVGNTLIAFTRTGSGVTVSSVTDPRGNTWSVDAQSAALNAVSAILRCNVVNPYSAGDTITINFSTSVAAIQTYILEYAGFLTTASPLDQTATKQGAGTTNTVGPTLATSADNEIVITSAALGAITPFTPPSGYTERAFGLASPRLDAADFLNLPSGSTPTVTWSWVSSTNFGLCIATYKIAPGANQALLSLGVG